MGPALRDDYPLNRFAALPAGFPFFAIYPMELLKTPPLPGRIDIVGYR